MADTEQTGEGLITSSSSSSPYHFELADLSGPLLRSLNAGASCRRRLRYTCSDVSPNVTPVLEAPARYLALGTTSGSVHVFQYMGSGDATAAAVDQQASDIQHYLTIIHEDLIGPVTSVAFAPVQLVVSRTAGQPNHDLQRNGNGLSTSTPSTSSSEGSNSDLDSSTSSTEQYSSPPVLNGHHRNGHHAQHHSHQGAQPANSTNSTHSLYNLVLAIGSSKGSLLIVDIDLQFQQQQQQKRQQSKPISSTSASFFSSGSNSSFAATRRWAVTYQSNSFTAGQAISLLRWDNSSRLFIGDTTGKLFVLHDVEEMKYLMLHSAPKMLLHILPPAGGGGDSTSDASQEGSSSSSSPHPSVATIHQVDVSERQLLVSTTEPRVYLFNLDDSGLLFPVGGAKATSSTATSSSSNGHSKKGKKSARKSTEISSSHCSGVTALATYRLLELTHFNQQQQQQQQFNSQTQFDENGSSSSSDFESTSNFYNRQSTTTAPFPSSSQVKAYRLVSTECTFYATRPKCRLWVVDHQGAVQFTQQYAELVKQEVTEKGSKGGESLESSENGSQGKTKSATLTEQKQPPLQENGLAVPAKGLPKRKKKSADHTSSSSSAPVLNFGKLYSMYWRHNQGSSCNEKEADEENGLTDTLAVYSYIVTYSTTTITNHNGTQKGQPQQQQSLYPRLFVIDPSSQVILATSPPIEGHIEEIKCVGNDVFVSYRTEPTASLQLAVLTLHFHPIFQKSTSTSSTSFPSTPVATSFSLLLNDEQADNSSKLVSSSRKSTLVNDDPVVKEDDHQSSNKDRDGSNVEDATLTAVDVDTDQTPTQTSIEAETETEEATTNTTEPEHSAQNKLLHSLSTPSSPEKQLRLKSEEVTLGHYLLHLRHSIMEQSVNRAGQQALLRLTQLLEKSSAANQSLTPMQSSTFSSVSATLPLKLKLRPNSSKLTTTGSKPRFINSQSTFQRGSVRVVDLGLAQCAHCHQSLSQTTVLGTLTNQRPKIKMYRSCEHLFHSTCLLSTVKQIKTGVTGVTGRCILCSGSRF